MANVSLSQEKGTEANGDMRAFTNSQHSRAAPKSLVNKENQPPRQVSDALDHSSTIPVSGVTEFDGLTSSIGRLSLDKKAENNALVNEAPVIKCLAGPPPQAQSNSQTELQGAAVFGLEGLSPEEVKAIEEEQAFHTAFTNDALDMVSSESNAAVQHQHYHLTFEKPAG